MPNEHSHFPQHDVKEKWLPWCGKLSQFAESNSAG